MSTGQGCSRPLSHPPPCRADRASNSPSFGDDLAGQCGHGESHLNEYKLPKRIESLVGRNVLQVNLPPPRGMPTYAGEP